MKSRTQLNRAALVFSLLAATFFGSLVFAQLQRINQKFVEFTGADVSSVKPGQKTKATLHFKVVAPNHINSNQPGSEVLLPTKLSLSSPSDVLIGQVTYPPGKPLVLDIAPDEKLSVYSGIFDIGATIAPTRKAAPSTYRVHGELEFQACSDRACYQPQKMPVEFDITVAPAKGSSSQRNPPQSPHAHS